MVQPVTKPYPQPSSPKNLNPPQPWMVMKNKKFITLATVPLLAFTAFMVANTSSASTQTYWQPANTGPNNGPEFQWYLGGPLNTSNATEMGTTTADLTGSGGVKTTAPTVYDIDAIENPASTVTTLHNAGDKTICYIEVGTAGNYYTADQEGITTTYYAQLSAAGDLGRKLSGYPERFININKTSALTIIESMIQKQCAGKGFDGVETDLDETFGGNEGNAGFTITQAAEQTYLENLANYMHSLGLAWIAKNLDDTGIQSFVNTMAPYAQGIITEECNYYQSCSLLTPFVSAGKLILNAEYTDDWGSSIQSDLSQFCPADETGHIDGTLFNVNLNGSRNACE
jgi:hypothetical protein